MTVIKRLNGTTYNPYDKYNKPAPPQKSKYPLVSTGYINTKKKQGSTAKPSAGRQQPSAYDYDSDNYTPTSNHSDDPRPNQRQTRLRQQEPPPLVHYPRATKIQQADDCPFQEVPSVRGRIWPLTGRKTDQTTNPTSDRNRNRRRDKLRRQIQTDLHSTTTNKTRHSKSKQQTITSELRTGEAGQKSTSADETKLFGCCRVARIRLHRPIASAQTGRANSRNQSDA